jgi:threonine dehydrogenase-like Zn-dependent dehydrogenase
MPTKMELAKLEYVPKGTPNSQKVAVLEEPGKMSIYYSKIPEPNPYEVRVKVKWVGVCGSDLEAFRGIRQAEFLSVPARLGHEVAGYLDKVGDKVIGLHEGQKITCRYVWGAYAEYIVCTPFNVKVVPDEFPLVETSLLEVFPGIIHAVELAEVTPTKNVLIMGQGVSGLPMTQIMKLHSPKNLAVTDLHDKNLELAKQYGATHCYKIPTQDTPTMDIIGDDFPDGFDVVIPCLLEGDGMVDAINNSAMCGRIVMYGCIGVCNKPIDFFKVHRKRLEIYSTEPRRDIDNRRFFQEGIQMALDGLVNTSELITDKLPLDDIQKAFELRNDIHNDSIHILVDCEQ